VSLYPVFWQRNGQASLVLPRVTWQVERLSWRAVGGPKLATIEAAGAPVALWDLVELLRCPAELRNAQGQAVWWGYVAEVEVQVDAITVSVSLDTMANRVAVAYAYTTADNPTGARATTAWAEDAESVAEYGTWERLESSSSDDTTTAASLRDSVLAAQRYPVAVPQIAPTARGIRASLQCRGWWETLSRRYYDNAGVSAVETTAQIAAIVAAVGEFVTAVDLVDVSGVSALEYRDGDTNAQAELEKLLERGSASGRRMLAVVTRERVLRIYQEPLAGAADLRVRSDGSIRDPYDAPLGYAASPAGQWARLVDVVPAAVNTSYLSNPSVLFVEEAEWDEAQARFSRLEPRGASALAVSRIAPV
jgi:hypothetical protein